VYKFKILFICTIVSVLGLSILDRAEAQDTTSFQIEDPSAITPLEFEIREITTSGLVTARESYLISSSGLRVGDRINIPGDEVSDAVRRLHRTGLFSDVQITHERVSGGVRINIEVQEQPRLQRYEITGVKRSHRRDLRERLNLLSGFAVTSSVRSQALNTIYRYYREEGYWNTEVNVIEEISDVDANRVVLTFEIDPGERIKVREINFHGNEEFSDRRLRREFSTIKQDRWWRIFQAPCLYKG
jgi:outer membrane protein insertion porin family